MSQNTLKGLTWDLVSSGASHLQIADIWSALQASHHTYSLDTARFHNMEARPGLLEYIMGVILSRCPERAARQKMHRCEPEQTFEAFGR